MTRVPREHRSFGDGPEDTHAEIARYAKKNVHGARTAKTCAGLRGRALHRMRANCGVRRLEDPRGRLACDGSVLGALPRRGRRVSSARHPAAFTLYIYCTFSIEPETDRRAEPPFRGGKSHRTARRPSRSTSIEVNVGRLARSVGSTSVGSRAPSARRNVGRLARSVGSTKRVPRIEPCDVHRGQRRSARRNASRESNRAVRRGHRGQRPSR